MFDRRVSSMTGTPMESETDASEASIPLRLFPSDLTAPSLSAPFKVDEGYSDDTRSQLDKELLRTSSDDVMSIPDWVLAHSEVERAGESSFPRQSRAPI